MSRLKKLSLGFLVLSVIFAANVFSVSAQENFVVSIGHDKIFTRFNYHKSGFDSDPNNPEPWPDEREAFATGNIAHVSLTATPGHAGQAMAFTGIQFQWNLGQYTWEEVKNWPVRITLNFSYQIEAHWIDPNGSANAGVVLPYNLVGEEHVGRSGPMRYYDWIGFEVGSSGTISETANETYTTRWDGHPLTVEELDGWGRIIDIQAYCQAHSIYIEDENGYPIGTTHYSHAEIQLHSIKIEFLEVGATVRIKDPKRPIVIFNPVSKSPKIALDTEVDPQGGTFSWEISAGSDKVRFVGSTDSEAAVIQGVAPSEEPNDVMIKVTYTVNSQEAEAVHPLTVQQPGSSEIKDGPIPDRGRKGFRYALLYTFKVYDTRDYEIKGERMPTDETRVRVCSNHPNWFNRIPLNSGGGPTNINGVWQDSLALPYYPLFPADFVGKVQQWWFVAGWPVGAYCQTYYSSYATSEPGPCGGCP